MEHTIVILSGVFSGLVMWLPFGIGLAAHRHTQAGIPVHSANALVTLFSRRPDSYSMVGRLVFMATMLAWLFIFFSAMLLPAFVANLFGLPSDSQVIGYAFYANLFMAVVGFVCGHVIWRKMANAA